MMVETSISTAGPRADSAATVFVLGGGRCAQTIATHLADCGIAVLCAPGRPGKEKAKWLEEKRNSRIASVTFISCSGFAGDFRLQLKRAEETILQQVDALVIAEDDHIVPNFEDYGISPGPRVMTLSELEEKTQRRSGDALFPSADKVAFFNGWSRESHPAVTRRMLTLCHDLQAGGNVQTFYFTNNLKVSSDGAERLCQDAKAAGTVFVKSGKSSPTVAPTDNGGLAIHYFDELSAMPLALTADWVIVDEHHQASRRLGPLAAGLGLFTDADGFVQSDNVHLINNATNRRGIFAAGGSRGIMSRLEKAADADRVTSKVLAFLNDADRRELPVVEIDRGHCVRCLTCLRLCPHAAIEYGYRMRIEPKACFSCGICAAGCPARAIAIQGVHIREELAHCLNHQAAVQRPPSPQRRVVVFGCSRSARSALDRMAARGIPMPDGLHFVEVPCGGAVSSAHLLAAFDHGADGVMLCTCHLDNCKSHVGNRIARRRGQQVLEILASAGVEAERLSICSIAANMDAEFAALLATFADHIAALPKS
jgi:quinone-modifying oxidoreductase subunit QmoB